MPLSDLSLAPILRFERSEILDRLRATVRDKSPIVAAGSSCGLVAKSAEAGGADLIVVYSTGITRLKGLPTTVEHGCANATTLGMAAEILNVVARTPVICGVEAIDPKYARLGVLLDQVQDAGYSGIINFPTVTDYEPGTRYRRQRDSVGFGFRRELDLISLARQRGLFTMAYVFTVDEAEQMARAGVDVLVPHVGGTSGGVDGFEGVHDFDTAVDLVNAMSEAAWAVDSDIISLAHGGPFDLPENVRPLYGRSRVQGFVGASSIERIPIEQGVANVVRDFKDAVLS